MTQVEKEGERGAGPTRGGKYLGKRASVAAHPQCHEVWLLPPLNRAEWDQMRDLLRVELNAELGLQCKDEIHVVERIPALDRGWGVLLRELRGLPPKYRLEDCL